MARFYEVFECLSRGMNRSALQLTDRIVVVIVGRKRYYTARVGNGAV
jgi:hypothetical protein